MKPKPQPLGCGCYHLAMNLAETGKIKRNTYFEMGDRYYHQLETAYFSEIADDQFATIARFTSSKSREPKKLSPPPDMVETSLSETLRHSVVDLLLLSFLGVVLITVAFLKFFSLDI